MITLLLSFSAGLGSRDMLNMHMRNNCELQHVLARAQSHSWRWVFLVGLLIDIWVVAEVVKWLIICSGLETRACRSSSVAHATICASTKNKFYHCWRLLKGEAHFSGMPLPVPLL
jgi:hypothetical protein